MPGGVVWYRKSDGQEADIRKSNPINIVKSIRDAQLITTGKESPLSKNKKNEIDKEFRKKISMAILFGFRKFGWNKAVEMKKYVDFTFIDILKNRFTKS